VNCSFGQAYDRDGAKNERSFEWICHCSPDMSDGQGKVATGKDKTQMSRALTCAAFVLVACFGMALAQSTPDAYAVQTMSKRGCPGIALHIVVFDKTIKGVATTGDMNAVSRVSGTRNGLGKFDMTLTPIDPNGPKGTISGDSRSDNASIHAEISGSGCNDGPVLFESFKITPTQ
jgi:hypothetical protein